MAGEYDCVIVGARCAGAPLATFLARDGARVLLIDASAMPRDQPISTHFIQPYGMTIIDELGIGARVREIAPVVSLFANGCEDAIARIRWPEGRGGCCPRRIDLDPLLVETAREAGAEVRLRCRAVGLVRDGERVTGVVVDERGTRREISAGVVVGADGRNSTIAELVGAEEYLGYDSPRCAYWGYWPRPSWYSSDARYQGGAFIVYRGDDYWFSFPTNRDQLLLGVAFPLAHGTAEWRADPRTTLERRLASYAMPAPLIEGSAPLGKVVGIINARFFFRRAAGPGWALVGDAGLFKDPTAGLGISDALRDARSLARAIRTGGDSALERYWRQRDVESIELYYFTRALGDLDYNNPLNQMVFGKMAANPALQAQVRRVVEREIGPFDAIRPRDVIPWTLGALLRGRFGVLPPFFAAARRASLARRELRHRKRLLVRQLTAARADA